MSSLTGGARATTAQAQAQAQSAQQASMGGTSLSYGSLKNRFLSGAAPKPEPVQQQQQQQQQPQKASKLFSLSR